MSYTAKLIGTKQFDTRKLIFEGTNIPTEEVFKWISSELEDIVYNDYLVFSTYEYLSAEKGFLLKKLETANWSAIHVALCAFFDKKFPGTKINYC